MKAKSIIVEIESVGQILFERVKRAKHINISVQPFKGVRVAWSRDLGGLPVDYG